VAKTFVLSVCLLSAALLVPLQAQDYSKFAFNIGGGVSTPLNPTAQFVGVSGNFDVGAGYNINKHSSVTGEFMWSGLPPNRFTIQPVTAPFGSINLYTLTAEYRAHKDSIGGSRFGVYAIAGGGWYYRHSSVDKNFVVPPDTVCQPFYFWWGYTCTSGGFVATETLAARGVSAGGVNAGAGFTLRLTDGGWKFYVESKYHYAFTNRIATTLIPVTIGFRFN